MKSTASIMTCLLLLVTLVAPISAAASTYQPQTRGEMIAYLYGRIAQLIEIRNMLERGGAVAQSSSQFTSDLVTMDTHKALEVEATTAVLRGEVLLYGDAFAQVWFEYGTDGNFLDQRTGKYSIRTAYDRAVRVNVSRLEEDERYYFRIAGIDQSGNVYYGPIHQFRTDESD